MAPDEINVTYTLYDRLIYGGAMPVNKILKLETFRELGPEITYFLERRELGVINVGGDGVVTVDGKEYPMKYKEALYVGCGNKEVTFKSNDATKPAKFYINSAPAYKPYVTQLITTDAKLQKANPKQYALAISDHYGKMEDSNDRIVNQLIVKAARAGGHVCAPSLWQKVIARCAHLRPDLESYDRNRKALYEGLTRMGYEMAKPDGAFYLFIKAPGGDANAFSDAAKKKDLLVVPGDGFGCPGYFRICYCVSLEMIQKSLPVFEELIHTISR